MVTCVLSNVVLSALERQRRLLEMLSKQESQNAEPVKPVRKRPARAQARRERRTPETGFFHSLDV